MTLAAKLESDYIAAYKAKDAVRLAVLRHLKTAMKNFQVEHMQQMPTDDEVLDLIARQCKQRQDSIEQFTSAGRPELAEKEQAEMEVLREYMPEPLTGDDLTAAIKDAIASVGATGMRDMSKVMQALMAAHKGQIDGKEGSAAVKTALQALA